MSKHDDDSNPFEKFLSKSREVARNQMQARKAGSILGRPQDVGLFLGVGAPQFALNAPVMLPDVNSWESDALRMRQDWSPPPMRELSTLSLKMEAVRKRLHMPHGAGIDYIFNGRVLLWQAATPEEKQIMFDHNFRLYPNGNIPGAKWPPPLAKAINAEIERRKSLQPTA